MLDDPPSRRALVLACMLLSGPVSAQEGSSVDSLKKRIEKLESDNKRLERIVELLAHTQWDSSNVADVMSNVKPAATPEDQRNRRARLNHLLTELKKRDGVLNFYGDATAVWQSFKSGSAHHDMEGSFDIFAQTQFNKRSLVFANLEAVGGNGPNRHVETLASLNADAGSTDDSSGFDRLHLLEVWWEYRTIDGKLLWTIGKIDLTNYFDNNRFANDETSQFLGSAFVNNTALAVPSNAPGFRIRYLLSGNWAMQLGFSSTNNSGRDIFDEVFSIASLSYRSSWLEKRTGTLRVFGYFDDMRDRRKGFGLSVDQELTSYFGIFGRYARNESELALSFGIRQAWSGGVALFKPLPAGLAVGQTFSGERSLKPETQLEIYCVYDWSHYLQFSPHVQFVRNAGGIDKSLVVVGIRSQFHF